MSKLSTCLWFDDKAEEAARFYTGLFKDTSMGEILRYGRDTPGKEGAVMTVSFTLFGEEFVALNGGPEYHFSPAVSFMVKCADQAEIDRYWDALADGGEEMQCGWVTDRFGVSWQITPAVLFDMLNDSDPQKAYRATQAMLKMVKLDIAELQRAYNDRN